MPIFVKKTEPENISEEIIKELQEEQPKLTIKKEQKELPLGTITVKILISNVEFANFTLLPELYNDAKILLKETLSKIESANLKITSNCECTWCKEKITELEKFLN